MNLFFDSIIVAYLVSALTFAVATFRDRKVPGKWEYKHPRITLTVFIVLCFSVLVVLWGSFVEPRRITINPVSIDLPNFDPTKPVRIALISDVHVGTYKKDGWVRRVAQRITQENPDFVFIAGDLIVDKAEHTQYLSAFEELTSKFQVYAVLGDHDYQVKKKPVFKIREDIAQTVSNALIQAGVQVLQNEVRAVEKYGASFTVVGLDDWLAGKTDMARALSSCHPERSEGSRVIRDQRDPSATPQDDKVCTPTLVLVHNPDFILDPESKNADLILAGNTHGGQIRLPVIGPVPRLPSKLPRTFDEGLFTLENGTRLFITSGISESGPRARLFNPPEIVILELY